MTCGGGWAAFQRTVDYYVGMFVKLFQLRFRSAMAVSAAFQPGEPITPPPTRERQTGGKEMKHEMPRNIQNLAPALTRPLKTLLSAWPLLQFNNSQI